MSPYDLKREMQGGLYCGGKRDPRLLRNLQYFDAIARHASMSDAADELGVSVSAVSHQARELSARLGEVLIERHGRGIRLTESGERLAESLAQIFASIDASIAETVGSSHHHMRIAVCSAFGPSWLAARLPEFDEANPRIDVELQLYAEEPELSYRNADAVFSAEPVPAGYEAIQIFEEHLVAVGRPDVVQNARTERVRMITTDTDEKNLGEHWYEFGRECGLNVDETRSGSWIKCSHFILALELAKAGMGIAMVPEFQAAEAIGNGTLERLNQCSVPSSRRYNFCYKTSRAKEPGIRAFAQWLRSQVRDYETSLPN